MIDLVTDVQQSSLPTRFGELAPRRPAELAIHDVAAGDAPNWTIDSFGGSALTGELEAVGAQLRGGAAQKNRASRAQRRDRRRADCSRFRRRAARRRGSRRSISRPGSNRVTVSLAPGDELAADDQRFLALKRPEPRSVLVVAADQRGRGALFTVVGARDAQDARADARRCARRHALGERPLTEYSFVVVTDAGLLGTAETAALQDYVQGGGRVLLAFGPRSGGLTAVPVSGELLRSTAQLGRRATRVDRRNRRARTRRCAASTSFGPRSSRATCRWTPAGRPRAHPSRRRHAAAARAHRGIGPRAAVHIFARPRVE